MFCKGPYPKEAARIAKLTPEEELFMVLVRLRVGLTITVSSYLINFQSPILGQ